MKYSIVIPTYNHCDDLLHPCIEAILKYSIVTDIELIISANGCKDNTFEYLGDLKTKFISLGLKDNIKIAWSDKALGFAKATNAGIKLATTDKIVLLNNDAVLLDQPKNYWLNILDSAFQNPKAAVSCVLNKYSPVTKRMFAIFFCVMIHRKVFDHIGLISEDYITGGHEDTDFCIRAEQAGYTIEQPTEMIWSPEAKLHVGVFPIYHKGEGTVHDMTLVPEWERIFGQNELILAKKYNPEWYEAHKNSATI